MLEMSMIPEMGMRVTPALLNLAQMLTLPSMALHQLVQQELGENPALEEVEAQELPCVHCGGPVVDGLCLKCASEPLAQQAANTLRDDDVDPLLFVAAPRGLTESLIADLKVSLPESEHPIAMLLVGSLDGHGFLVEELQHLADTLNVELERVQVVLQRLREVGPLGIATRDVRECMLVQLAALAAEGHTCPYAQTIVADYFDDFAAHRYSQIARQLRINSQAIEEVRTFLQQYVWPYPAAPMLEGNGDPDKPHYITPDVAIHDQNGKFVVEVLHSTQRMLRINPLYQELARRAASLEESERVHVQDYIARARTFLANLRQRESTLQQISETVVQRQEGFLRYGVRSLLPLTRAEIANELGLHESTVSRATADKTVLLPSRRSLPFSEFFVAARNVQDVLRELIDNESEPLSDAELARMLADRGYPIARRTVAKYRELMGILPSTMR